MKLTLEGKLEIKVATYMQRWGLIGKKMTIIPSKMCHVQVTWLNLTNIWYNNFKYYSKDEISSFKWI